MAAGRVASRRGARRRARRELARMLKPPFGGVAAADQQQPQERRGREVQQRELQELHGDLHRTWTFTVFVYSSNCDTRAVICTSQVPGTPSCAPVTV